MATPDVPGANPNNNDKLSRGCWAEHEDGSLIYVKDIDENDRVIFEMFDFKDRADPIVYSHAMPLTDFSSTFSYDPNKVETLSMKWTWHDKTPMPWAKVMKLVDRPVPALANVSDHLSAAARMAASLHTRVGEVLTREHIEQEQGLGSGPLTKPSTTIKNRLKKAIDALLDK